MHMGRHGRPKIAHRTWVGAWWHKRNHVRHFKLGADRISIYPCWFTDDNQIGKRKHWHIGHRRFPYWLRGTVGLTKAVIKATGEGGYRVSVILTVPELERLQALAGSMPVQEFTGRAILGLARTGTRCCHADPSACMLEISKNERRAT